MLAGIGLDTEYDHIRSCVSYTYPAVPGRKVPSGYLDLNFEQAVFSPPERFLAAPVAIDGAAKSRAAIPARRTMLSLMKRYQELSMMETERRMLVFIKNSGRK